jgi:hypothetical protein
MKSALFAGCSFVAGSGWPGRKQDPRLWVNLLHQDAVLADHRLHNVAQGGRSNAGIFQDAVSAISQLQPDMAFVSWTNVPRYEMHLGLETYETKCNFMPNAPLWDFKLNDIDYTQSYLENIRDRFTSLAHPHFELLNLVSYVNSLVNLSKILGFQLFFINAMCPWDAGFFDKKTNCEPRDFTDFTQKIINTNNRDDHEIFKLYDKIHKEYTDLGGIQETYWLNLYNPLRKQQIDVNEDGGHPGIKSNQQYYQALKQALLNQIGN